MKKQVKIIATLCLFTASVQSQNYGEVMYPHPSHLVSSGELTKINSSGFLTSLYEPVSSVESYNFILDKSDDNAMLSGPNLFSRGYLTFGSASCPAWSSQILNCAGVSAIEINPQPIGSSTAWYAVAGANSEGTFFTVMDNAGTPLNSVHYIHPSGGQNLLKPFIIESQFTPGEFYICGENGGKLYAIKVDVMGNVLWSSVYNFPYGALHPQAIIECPYSGDLTVVGYAVFSSGGPNRASDGFFLKLKSGAGGINVFKTYGHTTNACNEFFSINVAASNYGGSKGLIIGGFTDPLTVGRAWFVKVDPNGNVIWNRTMQGSTGVDRIVSVFERLNTMGMFEYFGVGISFSGYSVLKLDDGGVPFSMGSNEFTYDSPLGIWSEPISMKEVTSAGPSPTEGLHIFGNAQLSTAGDAYLASAYFNGVSGCETGLLNIVNSGPGPNSVIAPPILQSNGPTLCTNYVIIPFDLNTPPNFICNGPSVAGGSNARKVSSINGEELNSPADFAVYPNPVKNTAVISYEVVQNSDVTIELYNYMGQLVKTIEKSVAKEKGVYEVTLDLKNSDLANGVYFINTTLNNQTTKQKIIYSKE